jgi:NAD(P)-dependent dehydrogenase (short-subunit alcohol dehydrogenase family)
VLARAKAAAPDANVVFLPCDLASLASVKAAAEQFVAAADRLDVLICNAGIMAVPRGVTQDGYEVQFGTNHLGHALLVKTLLPTLRRTAAAPGADVRVVTLTSLGFRLHPKGGIHFDTLRSEQDAGFGGPWARYGQSKLANLLYARELARRVPELTSLAVHPGVVDTGLVGGLGCWNRLLIRVTNPAGYLTPAEGAYNELWAAFGDKADLQNGQMYEPVGQLSKQLDATAKDDQLAAKLWKWTEEALQAY